jgi:hypothetical protein
MPQDTPRGRGRPARVEAAEPTGYRVTAPIRRQLFVAMGFTDERTLQGIIDRAVQNYLAQLRETVPGFAEAAYAAEAHVTRQPANVTRLHRDH